MDFKYIDEQAFAHNDYSEKPLEIAEYEYCSFTNCSFSNSILSEIKFLECEFVDCNFSNADLANVSFQDVKFKNCKMLGLQFDSCNQFGFAANFDSCQLDHCGFFKMKLNRTFFKNSQLKGVDFTEADLKNSKLSDCNLLDAIFQRTNLEMADLRNAINYTIDPEQNRIKGAKFSLPEVIGLLDKYRILIER